MIDPISVIVNALVTGAAAGLKPAAEKAVKDAYEGLKRVIKSRYQSIDVDNIEKNPASEGRRVTLKEELAETEAPGDEEILTQAQAVLRAVKTYAPETAGAVNINLDDIEVGASAEIERLIADGNIIVNAQRAKVGQNLSIKDIQAGVAREDPPKDKGQ